MSDYDKARFEAPKSLYQRTELPVCFTNLHMTINKKVEIVKHELEETNEKV